MTGSVGRQQKILHFLDQASFMTSKNEENGRDKSYILIFSTSLLRSGQQITFFMLK